MVYFHDKQDGLHIIQFCHFLQQAQPPQPILNVPASQPQIPPILNVPAPMKVPPATANPVPGQQANIFAGAGNLWFKFLFAVYYKILCNEKQYCTTVDTVQAL